MTSVRKQTRTPIIKLLCINFLILLIGVIILELIFGNWVHPNYFKQLNITTNTHRKFKLQGLYPFDNDIVVYTKDEYGFRGDYPDVKHIDILTIGGSTTNQIYISDGYTWQNVLQQEFSKNGKTVFVVNAGVEGQSMYGHIKNFDWWFPYIPDLQVKYFLFYIGINDFYRDGTTTHDDLLRDILKKSVTGRFQNVIRSQSALFYFYRTLQGMMAANAYGLRHDRKYHFSTEEWTTKPLLSEYTSVMKVKLDGYAKRLLLLCEKARNAGGKPIFVTQTARRFQRIHDKLIGDNEIRLYEGLKYNGVDFYYMLQLLNNKTLEVAHTCGGIAIDLATELSFDFERDFYDKYHTTPSGGEKIGKYLYAKLKHLF